MDKQYAIDARKTLKDWGFNTADLSDREVVNFYHQEEVRRWRAFANAASIAGDSIDQLNRSFGEFHRALREAAVAVTQA